MEIRFTERSGRIIGMAQQEAKRHQATEIGTEHLLIALLRENEGVAAKVLCDMRVTLAAVRAEIRNRATLGEPLPTQRVWFGLKRIAAPVAPETQLSLQLQRAMDSAERAAARSCPDPTRLYIGTEHLLLGLLEQTDGGAARVLAQLGVDFEATHKRIMGYLPI